MTRWLGSRLFSDSAVSSSHPCIDHDIILGHHAALHETSASQVHNFAHEYAAALGVSSWWVNDTQKMDCAQRCAPLPAVWRRCSPPGSGARWLGSRP